MDSSNTPALHCCEIIDLLPIILNIGSNETTVQIPPSSFMAEMKLSTEERLRKQKAYIHKPSKSSIPSTATSNFEVTPEVVIFQNFKPGIVYVTPLTIRNRSSVLKHLRSVYAQSPQFTVTYTSENYCLSVAPGMAVQMSIRFCAEEWRDYKYQITFMSEGETPETFIAPIIAIGPRPLLDLPDHITVPKVPIKLESKFMTLVRNLGQVPAIFRMLASPPFFVNIEKGVLQPNKDMQLIICFKPIAVGEAKGNLIVAYESGEKLYITLKSYAKTLDISLEKGSLKFSKTYMGLKRQRTVLLTNNSKYVVKYEWKYHKSQAVDDEHATRMKDSMEFIKMNETIKSNKLRTYGIIDDEGHELIYNRILQNEIQVYDAGDNFMYHDSNFEIVPLKGEIWPNSSLEIIALFSPEEVGAYSSIAYLEATGRKERLKLVLHGESIGADIILSLEYLNVNRLYMCSVHQYELVATNKGDIPGELVFKPTPSEFGGIINCHPQSIKLKPNECKALAIEFFSKHRGRFLEEIYFEICCSKERIHFMIEGEVICPLLSIDVPEIDFGMVSIGYSHTKSFVLHNSSLVPIEFELYIQDGGCEAAITWGTYAKMSNEERTNVCINPQEFIMDCTHGVVEPNASYSIEITLTANICRYHKTNVCVRMWNSDEHKIELPIKYNAEIPVISISPSNIKIRFCFLRYPYKRSIRIKNETQLRGYFEIVRDSKSTEEGITYEVNSWGGFLKSFGEFKLDVIVETNILGEDVLPLYIKFFGAQPIQICTIICKGQGPVVTIDPEKMDFGDVKLLERAERRIKLTNESPIAAYITTSIPNKSKFQIEPRILHLPPDDSEAITVSLWPTSPVKSADNLKIYIDNGAEIVCPIKAKGYGTAILCEPTLDPMLNVGIILTFKKFRSHFLLTNLGPKRHALLWSHNPELKAFKESPEEELASIFKIYPKEYDLDRNEANEFYFECFHKRAGIVEEDFYCYALIGDSKKHQIIITCKIVAKFVEPIVELSKPMMKFRKDCSPDSSYEFLLDDITITNKSSLPIEIDASLDHPFYIHFDKESERQNAVGLQLNDNESATVYIEFVPDAKDKKCLVVESDLVLNYMDHPKIDKLPLTGNVNYPNVSITPNEINLRCLPTGTSEYQELMIRNISPMIVHFTLEWIADEFSIQHVSSPSISISSTTLDSNFSRASSDSGVYLHQLELQKLALEMERELENEERLKKEKSSKTESKKDVKEKIDSKKEMQKAEKPTGKTQSKTDRVIDIYNPFSKTYDDDYEIMKKQKIRYLQRAYIEKQLSFYYTQIRETLEPPLFIKDVLESLERNEEYMRGLSVVLSNLVVDNEEKWDSSIVKQVRKDNESTGNVHSVLNLEPIRGTLKPFECQYLGLTFYPFPNVSVRAKVECTVIGGATEFIYISGMSADISFAIDNDFIDFGRQVFCMSCNRPLKLSNTGYTQFAYSTLVKPLPDEMTSEIFLEAGSLTIFPKEGTLLPGDTVEFKVQYFPGIAGEFNETFTIEVGYLPPVTITVHGYGVFPQLYLDLPRPAFDSIDINLSYLAVASLTPDYLKSLKDVKNILHYNEPSVYKDNIPLSARQKLRLHNFRIISYNDHYPSIMDISLAVERMLLYRHIFDNPDVFVQHTKVHKQLVVPNFTTPPYLVDFGYVILETDAYYTVLLFNYGPISANIKLVPVNNAKNAPFERAGLTLKFSKCIIGVGLFKELCIHFHPTMECYPENNMDVSYNFYLQVAHGPTITVNIKAVVTVPTIAVGMAFIDFEDVKCGDCKKRSLLLRNNGHVTSQYHLKIQPHGKKKYTDYKSQNIFFLKSFNGVLEPEESCLLDVYFEPQYDGMVDWYLMILIDQNPSSVPVQLIGRGMKPSLKICESLIEFEPALPYVHKCEKMFYIENTSETPVEVFFSDFDYDVDEEEKLIKLATQYYSVNDLYIPFLVAGQKLPDQFHGFYTNFYDRLRNKLIKIEQERIMEEQRLLYESQPESAHKRSSSRGSRKRSSSISRKKSPIVSKARLSLLDKIDISDPLASKSLDEIQALTEKYIKELVVEIKSSEHILEHKDPVAAAIKASQSKPIVKDPTDLREGVFIIFHGGPGTNILQASNRAGKELGLPVYSIDKLLFESLAANESEGAKKLNDIIGKKFTEIASDIDLTTQENSDTYDEVEKKVELILSGKEKPKKKDPKKDAKIESSKPSKSLEESSKEDKDKNKAKDPTTFMKVPENLLYDILLPKILSFKTGIIIESLDSVFLRRQLIAFNQLLKAIGNVKYINFIMLSYTYEDCVNYELHAKAAKQKIKSNKQKQFLKRIYEMDADEYAKLTPRELTEFKELSLKKRKLSSIAKQEALKRRLFEKTFAKKVRTSQGKTDKKVNAVKGQDKTAPNAKCKDDKSLKSAKDKISLEEVEKKKEFAAFEADARNILHTLEFWDRKLGICLKPFQPNKGAAKAKKPETGKKVHIASKTSIACSSTIIDLPLTAEDELKIMQTGIPNWVILNAHKDKPVESLVAYYLAHTSDLQKAIEALRNSLLVKFEERIELLSVISNRPVPRVKKTSEIFVLRDSDMQDISGSEVLEIIHVNSRELDIDVDSPSQQSAISKLSSQASNLNRRKSSKRKSSGSVRQAKLASSLTEKSIESSDLEIEETFTPRIILSPGEIVAYKVIFKPFTCDVYNHTFTIEMSGWQDTYHLGCIGVCDIPKINMNPEILFKKIVGERTGKNKNLNSLFIKELNTFDFGPVLVNSEEDPNVLAIETEFCIKNDSLLLCESSFSFYRNAGNYDCKPIELSIAVDAKKTLAIRALPSFLEDQDDCLLISTKDNPKIEVIGLTLISCDFDFLISPKELNFERVPLGHQEEKFIVLENLSRVVLNWEFLESEDVFTHFNISPMEGILKPESNKKVTVGFNSDCPITIPRQSLKIFVFYNDCKCGPALYTDSVEITAEAMQVQVECLKEIVYGDIKGKFKYEKDYDMLNQGKYAIQYAFSDILPNQDKKYEVQRSLRNYFQLTPLNGVLLPGKVFNAKITFYGRKVIKFKRVPIFNCTFTDTLTKQIIESFPVCASGTTYFSSYEFCPAEQLNFGQQMVGSDKLQDIVVKNTGKFEFEYNVLSLKKIWEMKEKEKKDAEKAKKDQESKAASNKKEKDKSSKTDTKKEKESKSKQSEKSEQSTVLPAAKIKMKPTTLNVGVFTMTSSTGIIYPDKTAIINVSSRPKQLGDFTEKIVFFMTECRPKHKDGICMDLDVMARLPNINLINFDIIFREQYSVNKLTNFKHPNESGAHCVFVKDDKRLHFSHVMLNTEITARLCFQNEGPIAGELTAIITSKSPNVFTASPYKFIVESYSVNFTTVSFIPNGIGRFEGQLDVYCGSSEGEKLQVDLTGDGIVPEVALRQPKFNIEESCYSIKFNPIPVEKEACYNICFENVGNIPCQVIVEICEGSCNEFSLFPCDSTRPMLKVMEEEITTTAHTNIVNLQLGKSANFYVIFKPTHEGEFTCMVKIHTINNPFETFMIFVTAEGFSNDVTLEGLQTYTIKQTDSLSELNYASPGYLLNFGCVPVNLIYKKTFKITNHSLIDTYKFQFVISDTILFIPKKGHLKPKAIKDVIVTFFSKEPLDISKKSLHCTICKIQYVHPELEPLSWDERQNVVIWEPISNLVSNTPRQSYIFNTSNTLIDMPKVNSIVNNRDSIFAQSQERSLFASSTSIKTVREKAEPLIEIIPDSVINLQLSLTVLCNYSSYECNDEEIQFSETFLFEKQTKTFHVTNTSNVNLDLNWKISTHSSAMQILNSFASSNNLPNRLIRSASQAEIEMKSPRCRKHLHPIHLRGDEQFLDPPTPSHSSSLFSSEVNLTNFVSEEDCLPFVITPSTISIAPNQTEKFQLEFAPTTVSHYAARLQNHTHNLHPALTQLKINIKAKSLLPLVHFDLPPSNYVCVGRKGKKFCGDIADSNTKVVEFNAIGVGITSVRTFNIVNPSNEDVHFRWTASEVNCKGIPLFHCHKPIDFIEKGKSTEVMFSFLPQELGVFEAFYTFYVESHNFKKIFLLAGAVRDPIVYFSTPCVKVRPTVLGIDATEHIKLKNTEDFELEFMFKKDSLYSEARLQALGVDPMRGCLRPKEDKQIDIKFHPIQKGEVNFKLKCTVERMKKPLNLAVTAYCHDIIPIVSYDADDGGRVVLDLEKPNIMEFKYMVPHSKQQVNFTIGNAGETGFFYAWSVKEDSISEKLKFKFIDQKGFIKSKNEASSIMCITPKQKVIIKKLIIKLEIRYGPTYIIHLKGQAAAPPFVFSLEQHNFGPCFVQKQQTSYYNKVVDLQNNDTISITLECKMPDQNFLSIDFKSKQVEPKKSEKLTFSFHPLEVKKYHADVEFRINSVLHVLQFYGEGVLPQVRLDDPSDKFLDIGCVPVDGTNATTIKIINSSVTPVDIIFNLVDRLPYFLRPKKVLPSEFEVQEKLPLKTESEKGKPEKQAEPKGGKKEDKKDNKKDVKPVIQEPEVDLKEIKRRKLIRDFVSFSPSKFVKVKPQKSMKFTITFSPKERMDTFYEKVSYQIQDSIYTLCSFKGCCLGAEFFLEKTFIQFGTVVLGYQSTQKVIAFNLGQIGGAFQWVFDKEKSEEFTIAPLNGYMAPGTSVTFTIDFKPNFFACVIHAKLKCIIQGYKTPLELALTGSCSEMPLPKEVLKFQCCVRETDTKTIPITNPTSETWNLIPNFNGQYFVGTSVITISAQSTIFYELVYKPLTMCKEHLHEALVYIDIPEGKGLAYKLIGTTKPPTPVDTIINQINSKISHVEELNIQNWINLSQRFKVVTDCLTPQTGARPLYKLSGNGFIEVLPQSERIYLWKICVLNEGSLKFNVKFINETTKEYLFYEINLTITSCPFLEEFKITTCIRIPVIRIIRLQNPIKTSVDYMISSTSPELFFESHITIPKLTEHELEVTYDPVTVGEDEAQLTINTRELGSYVYNFQLTCNPPVPEPPVIFTCDLGQISSEKAFVTNEKKARADFTFQAVSVGPMCKTDFAINFEPDAIGTIQSSLILGSPITGIYIYPLIGTCTLPKPQGPFFVKPSGTTTIPFTNPFQDTYVFDLAVEPAIFGLKADFEEVKARRETKIVVTLLPLKNLEILLDQKYSITGKLIIHAKEPKFAHIKWVYYLQGDLLN